MIKKTDRNQAELMKQIRQCGWSVVSLHTVGRGVPDLAVGAKGLNFFLEVKDPNQPPSKRKLTPDEQEFFRTWQGMVHIVHCIDDVIKIVNETI